MIFRPAQPSDAPTIAAIWNEGIAGRQAVSARGCVHMRHARLDGEWRDVLLVERLLGSAQAR